MAFTIAPEVGDVPPAQANDGATGSVLAPVKVKADAPAQ